MLPLPSAGREMYVGISKIFSICPRGVPSWSVPTKQHALGGLARYSGLAILIRDEISVFEFLELVRGWISTRRVDVEARIGKVRCVSEGKGGAVGDVSPFWTLSAGGIQAVLPALDDCYITNVSTYMCSSPPPTR